MGVDGRRQSEAESFHTDTPPSKKQRRACPPSPSTCDNNDANETHGRFDKTTDAASRDDSSMGPACCSCRRKKAKCSRTQPCSQCVRLDIQCTYNESKQKPGMRTGAIEHLTQRVATLENMFLGQSVIWQQLWKSLTPDGSAQSSSPSGVPVSIHNLVDGLKDTLHHVARLEKEEIREKNTAAQDQPRYGETPGATAPVTDREAQPQPALSYPHQSDGTLAPLADALVDALVEIYFQQIHPWIPMLHVRQFRAMLTDPAQRGKLTTILHAITSLCIRFAHAPSLDVHPGLRARYASQSRQHVILASMESFSVENLQALIICAFDTVGSGRGPSAWSIVGSMTRTVEQLRLSIEDDEEHRASSAHTLIRRMAFLPPSASWTEAEERRRVFWNVFLMDRFCSIATGWNLSLTTADVKRRLPCEGALWEKGEPLKEPTPYFGVADQSYSQFADKIVPGRPDEEEQTSLGGFAYCIEATESLSLVTSFFLQHEVNMAARHDVQRWLMQFKQLDLRLVQWKVFLPEKWREACVLNSDGNMDPNLTLAHITQNTAVVLLHQAVAYPRPEWQNSAVRLPSASSAETCQAAANEVSIIADKFLQNSPILTNPQFAFCLFVCGRMLLSHAAHYSASVSSAFDSLVASLSEISIRWNGAHSRQTANLASRFASRLVQARSEGSVQSNDIRESAFAEQPRTSADATSGNLRPGQIGDGVPLNGPSPHPYPVGSLAGIHPGGTDANAMFGHYYGQGGSPDSISLAFPPLPLALQVSGGQYSVPMTPGPTQADLLLGQNENNMGFTFSLEDCDMLGQRISMFSQSNPLEDGR